MIPTFDTKALAPTAARQREPILDVLRGFAILGILLVNIQFMRGAEWMVTAGGGTPDDSGLTADVVAQFVIGWLASGKFLSCLAILFGLGAALIAGKSLAAGRSPRPLLARRYGWLAVFGLAHMLLLYPGDILFIYGVAGLILLAFVNLRPTALLLWAGAFVAAYTLPLARFARQLSGSAYAEAIASENDALYELYVKSIEAFTRGSYGDIVSVYAGHALQLQGYQVSALPWILALFVVGYAVGRSGVLEDFAARQPMLRRGAIIGMVIGLPVNIAVGWGGPLGTYAGTVDPGAPGIQLAATLAQAIGAPILAIGYLCALSLYCLRRGPIRPLAAVGRMALTAYLLQSALALAIIAGLRLYDRVSTLSSLFIVAGIWTVLLVACPWWLSRFQFGPVEWLWRSLTYGRVQPLRLD